MLRTLTIVLVVVLAITGCASSAPQAAPTQAPAAQPTKAPQPTVAPTPTPAPKAASIGKLDELVSSGDVSVIVTEVQRLKSLGQFVDAKDGNIFLLLDVAIGNTGSKQASYSPMYFKVKDAENYEYGGTLMNMDDHALSSGDLPAGETVRGTVAIEVPEDASGFVVSYKPMIAPIGYQAIRIALD